MNYRGRVINPITFWGNYCKVHESQGPFLPLTHCPNPDHDNRRSPAFQINIEQPTVHCFSGCGISGSYEHAIALIEGIYDKLNVTQEDLAIARTKPKLGEPPERRRAREKVRNARKEARRTILRQTQMPKKGGELHRKVIGSREVQEHKRAFNARREDGEADFLDESELSNYSYLPKIAMTYLDSRGINASSRTRWRIGFDEEQQRITIPVFDDRDRLRFLIRRAILSTQHPKYLYPDDSQRNALLFGSCYLEKNLLRSQGLIVVEGSLDCIRLHQYGFRNTVAILGSSISREQMHKISKLNPKIIYLFFDRDSAGGKAFIKSINLLRMKYPLRIVLYPKNKYDPAELTAKMLERELEKAITPIAFMRRLKKAGIKYQLL